MNEEQWFFSTSPAPMLQFMRSTAPARKCRLFAIACCRRINYLIDQTEFGPQAITIAERMADGLTIELPITDFRDHLWQEGFSWIDGYRKEKRNNALYHALHAAFYGLQ